MNELGDIMNKDYHFSHSGIRVGVSFSVTLLLSLHCQYRRATVWIHWEYKGVTLPILVELNHHR